MSERLRLADMLAGLSIAADFGFGLPPGEAMRSCLIATALAREHGSSENEVADSFYAGLLMHLGCSSLSHETVAAYGDDSVVLATVARTNLADPDDIASTLVPELTRGRDPAARAKLLAIDTTEFRLVFDRGSCEVASATARRIGLSTGVQRALSEVAEWWNGEGAPQGLREEEASLPSRIAKVAADAARFDEIGGRDAAIATLRRRAGLIHDPAIVDRFAKKADRILGQVHSGDPRELLLAAEPEPVVEIDAADLPRIAGAFGDLADMKAPTTHGHSRGVARLAKGAAEHLGLDRETTARLEISALLHDVGRIAVSNAIWEKRGALTGAEWEQVRMHAYHSERILATSSVLEPMARIAGMHHERLDGSGYHRGCRARELPPAARLLAAADAFQAMTQVRLHRLALSEEEAAEELKREVRAGRFDSEAADAVLAAAGRPRSRRRENVRPGGLSEREIEVARLVAAGHTNAEIADRLVISRRTAEHHVQHIYAKTGISSRAGLALFAHEHELV